MEQHSEFEEETRKIHSAMLKEIKSKEPPVCIVDVLVNGEYLKIEFYSNGIWTGLPSGSLVQNNLHVFDIKFTGNKGLYIQDNINELEK